MVPVLLLSIVLVLAAFAMFSLRILFIKDGEFRGTCASNNPYLKKEGVVCGVCGRKQGESCAKDSSSSANG